VNQMYTQRRIKYQLLIRNAIYRFRQKIKGLLQGVSRIFKKRADLTSSAEGRFAYKKLRKTFTVKRPSFYARKGQKRNNCLRYDQVFAKRKRDKKANSRLFKKYHRKGKAKYDIFADGEVIKIAA